VLLVIFRWIISFPELFGFFPWCLRLTLRCARLEAKIIEVLGFFYVLFLYGFETYFCIAAIL